MQCSGQPFVLYVYRVSMWHFLDELHDRRVEIGLPLGPNMFGYRKPGQMVSVCHKSDSRPR